MALRRDTKRGTDIVSHFANSNILHRDKNGPSMPNASGRPQQRPSFRANNDRWVLELAELVTSWRNWTDANAFGLRFVIAADGGGVQIKALADNPPCKKFCCRLLSSAHCQR